MDEAGCKELHESPQKGERPLMPPDDTPIREPARLTVGANDPASCHNLFNRQGFHQSIRRRKPVSQP